MPIFLIFVDALDEEEVTGVFKEYYQTGIKDEVLNVTPQIVGPMFTGKDPAYHNLIRSTKLYEQDVYRPACKTLIEQVDEDIRVLSYEIPFTVNVQPKSGVVVPSAPQVNINIQQPFLFLQKPKGDLTKVAKGEQDMNNYLNAVLDYTREWGARFRNLARNNMFDVFILSYRYIDALTHFYHKKERKEVINVLEDEVWAIQNNFPTLFFSDHGGRPKEYVFRINKWLIEKGYLDVDVHLSRWKKQVLYGDNGPDVEEQIGLHQPFVQIQKDSKAFCADAFDATVDVQKDVSEKEISSIIEDLESTKYFDRVYHKKELYDENGSHYDEIPTIIPKRAEGVLVTGNVHPNCGITEEDSDNQGSIRSGVHRRKAAVLGSNKDLELGKDWYDPKEVYGILKNFIEEYAPKGAGEEKQEEQQIKSRLQRLGYV